MNTEQPTKSLTERLYPNQHAHTHRHSIPDTSLDHTTLTSEQKAQQIDTARQLAHDMGMSAPQASRLEGLGRAMNASPPDQETREQWRTSVNSHLRMEHGHDAERVMADARQFIKQHPDFAKRLDGSPLGDHPDVVKMMVELSQRAKREGRLQ